MKKAPPRFVLALLLAPLANAQESAPPAPLFESAPGPETRTVPSRANGAVHRARPVRTRAETLAAVSPGARVRLNLFADVNFDAVVERDTRSPAGDRVLAGSLLDGSGGTFLLVDHAGELAGDVLVSAGERYALRHPAGTGAGGLEVRAIEPAAEPACGAGREVRLSTAGAPRAKALRPHARETPPVSDGSEFSVLVAYTPAASAVAGGVAAVEALAALCVENANACYEHSDIGTRMRLAGVVPVDYAESGDLYTDTIRLAEPADGYGDAVHDARAARGADLVSVFEADVGNDSGYGIWTTIHEPDGTRVLDGQAGFSTVVTVYASPYTFAHEVGHNFGCQHDREHAQGPTLAPYAYGWRWTGSNKTLYRDVMAYAPGERVAYFSNPRVSFAGVPTGVAEAADTARMMNERRGEVANFHRALTPPLPTPPDAPPTVAIEATGADAYEAGVRKGFFTVRRSGQDDDGTGALTVGYRAGGTATGGVQYRALPGLVTIPAGQTEARVQVKPLDDGAAGGDVTVKLTLTAGAGYQVGSPAKAKVKIHDAPAP